MLLRRILALLYVSAAIWIVGYAPIRVFPDSRDYLHVAAQPFFSLGFWAALKSPGAPFFFKLCGGNQEMIVRAQLLFYLASWLALAMVLARTLQKKSLQTVAFAGVLAFSLSGELVFWNKAVLSEAWTTSLLACVAAAWHWVLSGSWEKFSERRQLALGIGLVAAMAVWSSTRDTNMYMVAAVGCLAAAWLTTKSLLPAKKRQRPPRFLLVAVALGSLGVFALQNHSANLGYRWRMPLVNTLGQRILPNPERVAFFSARGMPTGPSVMLFSGRWAGFHNLSGFGDWLNTRGKSVYVQYLLWHPLDRIQELHRDWDAVFSSDLSGYFGLSNDPIAHRVLSYLVYYRGGRWWLFFAVTLLLTSWAFRKGRYDRRWVVPVFLLLLTYPMAFLCYHGDAMEITRHGYGVALQARLGAWILFWIALDAFLVGKRRSKV